MKNTIHSIPSPYQDPQFNFIDTESPTVIEQIPGIHFLNEKIDALLTLHRLNNIKTHPKIIMNNYEIDLFYITLAQIVREISERNNLEEHKILAHIVNNPYVKCYAKIRKRTSQITLDKMSQNFTLRIFLLLSILLELTLMFKLLAYV